MYSAKIGYKSQTTGGTVGHVETFPHMRRAFPSCRAAALAMAKWLRSELEGAKDRVVTQTAAGALAEAFFLAAVSLAEETDPDPWTPLASGGLRTCTAVAVDDDGQEHEVEYEIQGA